MHTGKHKAFIAPRGCAQCVLDNLLNQHLDSLCHILVTSAKVGIVRSIKADLVFEIECQRNAHAGMQKVIPTKIFTEMQNFMPPTTWGSTLAAH